MAHDYEARERVAEEVRALLARRRRTGTDLAEVLGVSEATAYRRLAGDSAWSVDEVAKVARWLDVPVTALLTGSAA